MHFGLMLQQGIEITLSAQEKHAAVPVKIAGLEVFGSRVGIGLFHKLSKLENTRGQFRTPTNVPIARLRSRGHHAKGHKVPCLSTREALLHRLYECAGIANVVVRRQHQQDCVGVLLHSLYRSQGNRRRRVTACRL